MKKTNTIKEYYIGFEKCKKPVDFVLNFFEGKIINHIIEETTNNKVKKTIFN